MAQGIRSVKDKICGLTKTILGVIKLAAVFSIQNSLTPSIEPTTNKKLTMVPTLVASHPPIVVYVDPLPPTAYNDPSFQPIKIPITVKSLITVPSMTPSCKPLLSSTTLIPAYYIPTISPSVKPICNPTSKPSMKSTSKPTMPPT